MKVKVLRDTYDHKAGSVVDMPRDQAFAWVKAELAEFVKPKGRTKVQVEDRVVDTPENRTEEEEP